jgi:O-antigen/teichoic acid export membrane protein
MMKRDLRYGELSIVRVLGALAETTVKLGCAALANTWGRELAIWGFVLGPIANALVTTIATLRYYPWRPRFAFQRDIARRAIRFTAAVSGGELLYFAYTSADYLVIGTWFGDAAVGVYRLAYELVLDVVRLLSLVTTEVAFPTFVRVAGEPAKVADHLLRFTRQNLIVLAPFLVFVGVEADDLLRLLFGVLPPEAATIARVLCVVGALRTLGFILPAMLAGIGRANRVLVYHALAAVVLSTAFVLACVIAPQHGSVAVAWAWALGYPIPFVALLAMALPKAELSMATYVRNLVGVIGCAAIAVAAALGVRALMPASALRPLIVGAAVLAVYVAVLAPIAGVRIGAIVRGLRANAGSRPGEPTH